MSRMLAAILILVTQDDPANRGVEFLPPTPVLVEGRPVYVQSGHAAPAWADIDGDGVSELLVGQFEGGTVNIYRHSGDMVFGFSEPLQAGGGYATVDYG